MDSNVDVYVKEVSYMMGRKETKFDQHSMAYKTLTSTKNMFRIIAFMSMALEASTDISLYKWRNV